MEVFCLFFDTAIFRRLLAEVAVQTASELFFVTFAKELATAVALSVRQTNRHAMTMKHVQLLATSSGMRP